MTCARKNLTILCLKKLFGKIGRMLVAVSYRYRLSLKINLSNPVCMFYLFHLNSCYQGKKE